jgi:hypothetical protein
VFKTLALAERGAERLLERGLERGLEAAGERALEATAERLLERGLERGLEAAGERALERGGQRLVTRLAPLGAKVAQALLNSVSILLPAIGGLFSAYLARGDLARWREVAAAGGPRAWAPSAAFALAAVCDALDAAAHACVVAAALGWGLDLPPGLCAAVGWAAPAAPHGGEGHAGSRAGGAECLDAHRLENLAEWASFVLAITGTAAALAGEALAAFWARVRRRHHKVLVGKADKHD